MKISPCVHHGQPRSLTPPWNEGRTEKQLLLLTKLLHNFKLLFKNFLKGILLPHKHLGVSQGHPRAGRRRLWTGKHSGNSNPSSAPCTGNVLIFSLGSGQKKKGKGYIPGKKKMQPIWGHVWLSVHALVLLTRRVFRVLKPWSLRLHGPLSVVIMSANQ